MKRLNIILCLLIFTISFQLYSGPSKNPILKVETENHVARINRISTDANNRYIVTFSGDKTARVWDYNGRLLKVLRPPIGEGHEGKLYSGAISPDGKIVVCGGWTGYEWDKTNSLYIFNRETGKMIKRVPNIPGVINDVNFSPDGNYIAIAMGSGYGIRLYETKKFSMYGEDSDYEESSYGIIFHNNYVVSLAYDNYIRIYEYINGFKLISKTKTLNNGAFYVSVSPNGRYMGVTFSYSKSVEVYNFNNGRPILSFVISNPDIVNNDWFSGITFSNDSKYIYIGGSFQRYIDNDWKRIIFKYNLKGELIKEIPSAGDLIISLKPIANGGIVFASTEPSFGIINLQDNITLFKSSSIPDLRSSYNYFFVSYDGSKVGFNLSYNKNPIVFSIKESELKEGDMNNPGELTSPDVSSLNIENWDTSYSKPIINGKQVEMESSERSMSLAIMPDKESFIIGGDYYLYRFDTDAKTIWKTSIPGVAWSVNVSGNGKFIIALLADGTIRWYKASDGKELLALFVSPDKKRWVIWSPSGYYDSSVGGEDLIGWHINNSADMESDFFPASRFRTKFYRPEVIAKIIEKVDENIAIKESSVEKLKEIVNKNITVDNTIRVYTPPVVNIIDPYDGFSTSNNMITIKYTVRTPNNEPITGLKVLIDGRPVSITKGLSIVPKEKNKEEVKEITINIPEKDSEISIIAENRFSSSQPASIRIKWEGKTEFVIKPKLYVLAIGVSKYEDPKINKLEFAAKDASDFANSLISQKDSFYRDIEVKVIVDKDATKDNILDGLEWIQREVTSKDVAMIFISGHGVNDPTGIYYYLPVNANLDKLKRTGVPFSDIKNTAIAIPGKVIMFIDTCHSGNIMGTRRGASDMNSIINELASAENGLVVFTSSTGSQYSLEDKKWGNGAFTKALIEGLSGKADYTGKGKITINMLDLYISERVKELTGGVQTPTSIKPATVPDFPIAIKRR